MESTRLDYLDRAKGIGIILVVLGHLAPSGYINQLIYSFHMPLFFFITGFIIFKKKSLLCKEKLVKLCKGLLIPYFVFGLFYLFFYEWLFLKEDLSGLIYMSYQTICFRGMAPLWFLGSLFWTEIALLAILKIEKQWTRHCFIIMIFFLNMCFFSKISYDEISGLFSNPMLFVFRTSLCLVFMWGGVLLCTDLFRAGNARKYKKIVVNWVCDISDYISMVI